MFVFKLTPDETTTADIVALKVAAQIGKRPAEVRPQIDAVVKEALEQGTLVRSERGLLRTPNASVTWSLELSTDEIRQAEADE